MKKLLVVLLALALVLPLAACEPEEDEPGNGEPKEEGYELALVTDKGTIDDKSFNQGAWEGLKKYAEENGITHKYYKPAEQSDVAYLDAIALAVEGGAKLVVCPGFLFEPAIYEAQDLYPDVKFIILDGAPKVGNNDPVVKDNVYSVYYAEEQAGFLAGYAAVREGYTKLGFMGGMAVPAVVRFGYGYIQGADYAAKEMGLDEVEIKYHYTGDFIASPDVEAMAASWYNAGTEIIFGCGGAVGNSVMAAAEKANTVVIGVDVDQSGESDTVITSAMKELAISVYDGIAAFYDGKFPGGQIVTLDAKVHGVGLPMESSKFKNFTQEEYDAIFKELVDGNIDIYKDVDEEKTAYDVPVEIVEVEVIGN